MKSYYTKVYTDIFLGDKVKVRVSPLRPTKKYQTLLDFLYKLSKDRLHKIFHVNNSEYLSVCSNSHFYYNLRNVFCSTTKINSVVYTYLLNVFAQSVSKPKILKSYCIIISSRPFSITVLEKYGNCDYLITRLVFFVRLLST